jgi:hypothetical protein
MIEVITTTLNNLSALNAAILGFVSSVLALSGVAANIAVFLPPPSKPDWYETLHGFINWAGRNVGRAENKD